MHYKLSKMGYLFMLRCLQKRYGIQSSSSFADHYNRIREHRRINRRSKHRFLDKPILPLSSFVAYSSLPLSSSKASLCGLSTKHAKVNTNTQKQSRSKKVVGPDGLGVAEPPEPNNTVRRADLQNASCKEISPFAIFRETNIRGRKNSLKGSSWDGKVTSGLGGDGVDCVCQSDQISEAKLDQAGVQAESDGIDTDGKARGFETKQFSFMNVDQRLGKESTSGSYQHEFDWSLSAPLQHTRKFTTTRSSLRACTVDSTAKYGMMTEDNQLVEGNFYDCRNCHAPVDGGLHYKAFLREKFFSTRRSQHNTICQQKLMIHHHEAQCFHNSPDLDMSSDHFCHDDTKDCSRICSSSFTNADERVEHVDVALLATETANLLERLLPLVANPGTMQTFISNLDTWSPRPSPREHLAGNNRYQSHLCTEREKGATSRPRGTDEQTSTRHDSLYESEEFLEGYNLNDDASVLAELEEAVGRTVDDILRRHILISPAPAPAPASVPMPTLLPPTPLNP